MDALKFLRQVEGEKLYAYQDSAGYWTLSVGICIDERKGGLRPEESAFISSNRLNVVSNRLISNLPWYGKLDDVRKAVCISMTWQVGDLGLWPNFCQAMAKGDFPGAAAAMLDSKVAKVTSPERWQMQAQMMTTGLWPDGTQ